MANLAQIKSTLQKPYDYLIFAKDVLSPVFGAAFSLKNTLVSANILPTATESQVIDKVFIYGIISLEDGTEITCYQIILQPKVRIEQSKIAIQRYARKLLTVGQAALVNFVNTTNTNTWRLTLIAKDSALTEKGIAEKATNAKRYTYLLGPAETCKTAAERFEVLSSNSKISLDDLVKAFSVEKLGKIFFDEYLVHYNRFVDYLNKSAFRQSAFNANEKAIRDFTKKMLGRVVFLYFVQKKGWLGATDTNYTNGLTNFITHLFKTSGANDTFYPNWLSVLFFDTLNKARLNDDFTMPDGNLLKIPFLNGGLFDKDDNDKHILTFKPELFHNVLSEDDPKNRGFLDFLNAFNFTVHEDSPDEHTIAVDPEMLGHIFENLLEDNKDKGAYYTPKEIVHYMCQESLLEYLKTNISATTDSSKNVFEESLNKLVKFKEIEALSNNELITIDKLLTTVKICDPAIGSGAFPMGLLHEIFAIKQIIAFETGVEWKPATVKEDIIQNSIYGVDIEKGAVDIARLRFWLSLVVDEEKPKALPNLDYKIVVGNSLVSKFEDEIIEIDWSSDTTKAGVFGQENKIRNIQLLKTITDKHKTYFHSENINKKKLFNEIRNLKIDILINQLELMVKTKGIEKQPTISDKKIKERTELYLQTVGWKNNINKLKNLKEHAEVPFNHFDWQLDFPEVLNPYLFESKSSSEVAVANAQILALNKQIDAINKHLEQQKISEHLIHLQANIAQSQIIFVKELLSVIEKTISTIYGEVHKVDSNVAKEDDLSFIYKIKSINKGIVEINKKITKINPQINNENANNNLGFDIVIGNPPYVGQKGHKEVFQEIKKLELGKKYHQRRMDLFYFFFHLGIQSLKNDGILTLITTNYYLTATYSDKLRKHIYNETTVLHLVNFNELKIFESAQGQHNLISILQKGKNINFNANTCITNKKGLASGNIISNIVNRKDDLTNYYCQSQDSLFEKNTNYIRIESSSSKNIDGHNIFSILNMMTLNSYTLEKYCFIEQGIVSGADKISNSHLIDYPNNGFVAGEGIYILTNSEINSIGFNENDKKNIKKVYKNSEIEKWIVKPDNTLNVIYIKSNGDYFEPSPLIKKHLDRFKIILINRNVRVGSINEQDYSDFIKGKKEISYIMNASSMKKGNYYSLSYARRYKDTFEVPKIVNSRRSKSNIFAFENKGYYEQSDIVITTLKPEFNNTIKLKFILCILNSKLMYKWLYIKGKRKGDTLELFQKPISEIPIKLTDYIKQNFFIIIVDYILFLKNQDLFFFNTTYQFIPVYFEQIIDGMVYELYFPELLKDHKREIMQYLGELPELTETMSTDEKMDIIQTVFNRLNAKEHPVRVNLFYMNTIPEIALIEGKQ